MRLEGKTDLITGGSRGIGCACVARLAAETAPNLGGTCKYCHAVSKPMLSRRRGCIANISSVAAEFGSRGQLNYAAGRGGVDGLTRCRAKELAARKVRVNAFAHAVIASDMSKAVRNLAGDRIKESTPLRQVGRPEGITGVVAFLARSSFKTELGCHCWLVQQCESRQNAARQASSGTPDTDLLGFETASSDDASYLNRRVSRVDAGRSSGAL